MEGDLCRFEGRAEGGVEKLAGENSADMNKTNLKARGWTDTQIKQFLGAPDWTAINPMYKCAAPVCHYKDERVVAVEASPEFASSKLKVAKRKEAATKAVETKRQQMDCYLETVEIKVPVIARGKLLQLACDSYNDQAGVACDRTPQNPIRTF